MSTDGNRPPRSEQASGPRMSRDELDRFLGNLEARLDQRIAERLAVPPAAHRNPAPRRLRRFALPTAAAAAALVLAGLGAGVGASTHEEHRVFDRQGPVIIVGRTSPLPPERPLPPVAPRPPSAPRQR